MLISCLSTGVVLGSRKTRMISVQWERGAYERYSSAAYAVCTRCCGRKGQAATASWFLYDSMGRVSVMQRGFIENSASARSAEVETQGPWVLGQTWSLAWTGTSACISRSLSPPCSVDLVTWTQDAYPVCFFSNSRGS